ncbi:hypothetical protein PUNSTDRAFT_90128 [Punctularia strigosozonata HHB-11173 SS5]|uniref:uncharacterized protein n=1 Tax=Punctularia strigosozonata (strain HHB-11173) TaxID=741275 RepID=UPI0004416FB1|nr:uncharacterized protein PUNSTDRAFT_90128 [Punctularia strigosozonata HHB-11173 SS5]EIN06505.1 hypothetical protein PUNSTDRAFT_90128 [Punctularia strigosozonata HHB-11173 SS5]
MPPEALDIIRANLRTSIPNALVSVIHERWPYVSPNQIHRAWSTMSEILWKRQDDQFTSGCELLTEYQEQGRVDLLEDLQVDDGVTILAWGLPEIAAKIGATLVEVAMDATYNTNAKDLELYSVLGEVDGAGFPMAYCLLSTATAISNGKRKRALSEFLRALRDRYSVNPQFVHTDKDIAEIKAAQEQWPYSKNQLCWWHLRRAIRTRLGGNLRTTAYDPRIAKREFPFIDLNFVPQSHSDPNDIEGESVEGSALTPAWRSANSLRVKIIIPRSIQSTLASLNEPTPKDHTTSTLAAISDSESITQRRVFCPKELHDSVLKLVDRHFHAHPLIPGYSAPSEAGIREWAVKEVYSFCVSHELRELWAYLWGNWYRPGRWGLWARSKFNLIPRLKTTMICESHWRRIKKDFLHHFHKPRIDLLIWILTDKLVPAYTRRLSIHLKPTGRNREQPSWRKSFKRAWRKCESAHIRNPDDPKYSPDAYRWVCTCPAFATSRFLICKHLIQACHTVPPQFFLQASRNRTLPFWHHPLLKPLAPPHTDAEIRRDEGLHSGYSPPDAPPPSDSGTSDIPNSSASDAFSSDPNAAIWAGGDDELQDLAESFDFEVQHLTSDLLYLVEAIQYNAQFRDPRFLRIVKQRGTSLLGLIDDFRDLQRRTDSTRTPNPNTWGSRSYNTMYFRTLPSQAAS